MYNKIKELESKQRTTCAKFWILNTSEFVSKPHANK